MGCCCPCCPGYGVAVVLVVFVVIVLVLVLSCSCFRSCSSCFPCGCCCCCSCSWAWSCSCSRCCCCSCYCSCCSSCCDSYLLFLWSFSSTVCIDLTGDSADTSPRRGRREQALRFRHLRRHGEHHRLPGEARRSRGGRQGLGGKWERKTWEGGVCGAI